MDAGRIKRMARMLAASEVVREHGLESVANAESALGPDAAPARPADVIDSVDVNLTRASEINHASWCKARESLLRHGLSALEKVKKGDHALNTDEAFAMEAVIISDGTRPSFLLAEGKVDPNDPFLRSWSSDRASAEANGSARLAKAVGRIQPEGGHAQKFFGTGTLIDREHGLILTNYHVIDDAGNYGVAMTRGEKSIQVDGYLEIDFLGESTSLDSLPFRIIEVLLPEGYGRVFRGNDVVVARLDLSQDATRLPKSVATLSDAPKYANGGGVSSLATIGFPAKPEGMTGNEVDWGFVLGTMFNNQFGVKRLAPGNFTERLGSHPDDAAKRAIGHDATTFGGASGSLLAAWLDTNTPAFAIHFGGATGKSNYGLAFAVAGTCLRPLGVGFE
jgi:hypothetical protein